MLRQALFLYAAAVAAQGVLENRPTPISEDAPNPYAELLAGLPYSAPTPAELDNFHLLLPNATEEDIQAFLEKDAGRVNETEGFTEGVDNDTIDTQGSDAASYSVPTEEELIRRAESGRDDPANQGIIADRILSGEYSLTYKHNKYVQHTKGTKLYEQVTQARGKLQSYLTISEAEAQALIYQYAGTGTSIVLNNGEIAGFEYVTLPVIIGKYFDMGEWHYTTRAKIIYAKSGVHIVPVSNKYEKIT